MGALDSPGDWVRVLVCGLSSPSRERRLLMVLTVFVDDSGLNSRPVYALGGWLASAAQWQPFSNQWAETLKRIVPGVRVFKMGEAVSLTGQFYGVCEEKRNELFWALGDIIEHNGLVACSAVITHELFQRIKATVKKLEKPRRRPEKHAYFWLYYSLIGEVMNHLKSHGILDPVDFIFDNQVMEKSAVTAAQNTFRSFATEAFSDQIRGLTFSDDEDALELQAADMCVWLARYQHEVDLGRDELIDLSWIAGRNIGWVDAAITEDSVALVIDGWNR